MRGIRTAGFGALLCAVVLTAAAAPVYGQLSPGELAEVLSAKGYAPLPVLPRHTVVHELVDHVAERPDAMPADVGDGLGHLVGVAGTESDVAAFRCQLVDDGATDAARAAGDQRLLSLQMQVHQNCTRPVSAPSTMMLAPVMKLAHGLATKATALATSCGVPMRPSGLAARLRLNISGCSRSR